MAQTLFERLVYGPEQVELKHYNPVKAKVGTTFMIDTIDFPKQLFTLREIWEYKRKVNGKTLTFADYVLRNKEDVWIRLRFMPVEVPDSQLTHNVLLLQQYEQNRFDKGLDDALRAGSTFTITDHDKKTEDEYWRLGDLTESFHAEVNILKDADNDGRVKSDEVETHRVEYWDYHRDLMDEAKQQYTQFLFVELDKKTKMQTMWRGSEIDPSRVTIL